MPPRPAFLALLLVAPLFGQDDELPTVREQVVDHMRVVRSRRGTIDDKVPAMEALLELGPAGAQALSSHLARQLRSLRKQRLEDQGQLLRSFEQLAGRIGRERAGREHASEIEGLRRTVLQGAVTKTSIGRDKDPAVARLGELLQVRVNDVWDEDEDLYEDFGVVLDAWDDEDFLFGYWWDARAILTEGAEGGRPLAASKAPPDPAGEDEELLAALDELARYALDMTEADRKVMRENAGDFEELDPKEADGIVELNDLRVLLGLNALRVDVRLCRACRGHSRDMVEGGFFSHSSPVEGKETPWKRAALEGTSAGAENIAAGAAEGPDAIRMWWYSPGHHRNMLGGHRRVGLGRHQGHWTQCFGG